MATWQEEILKGERADYGKESLATLSRELTRDYGRGFRNSSLTRMVRFAQALPDGQIFATLSQQLSWSHFKEILSLKEPLKREFYAATCRVECWNTRMREDKIGSMLYEHSTASSKPEKAINQELARLRAEDHVTHDMPFADPAILRQLALGETYSEKELEEVIFRGMQPDLPRSSGSGL